MYTPTLFIGYLKNTDDATTGRSTSIRLNTISDSLSSSVVQLREDQARLNWSHKQEIVELKTFNGQTSKTLFDRQHRSVGQSYQDCVVTTRGRNLIHDIREPSLDLHSQAPKCNCCFHERYSKRSPRVADRTVGTLFVEYSNLPYLIGLYKKSSYAQSCTGSHFRFSLAYFFPIWFLSCAIILVVQDHARGFDFNFRVLRYVSYSSPIFQYAYQGDALGMKNLLGRRLGSPFDVTSGPQRSLLGVRLSFTHKHSH